MTDRNVRIYTADVGLQTEDRLLRTGDARAGATPPCDAAHEASLAQFCAFVDFYTRKAADPFSTSLACEKQAEALELRTEEATPENLRLLLDTMLEAIEHLEQKWLDEQLKHEDRQRQHREDVARLYAQIRALQPESHNLSVYRRSVQAIHSLFARGKSTTQAHKIVSSKSRQHDLVHA